MHATPIDGDESKFFCPGGRKIEFDVVPSNTAGVVYFLHLFVCLYGNKGLPSGATGMPYGPIKTSEPETNDFIKVLRGALVNTYNISIKHGTREFKTKRKNN